MKVKKVETVPLSTTVDEPYANSQAWVRERSALLVRIETNEGITGYGECWGPRQGNEELVEKFLGPVILDENPAKTDFLFHKMKAKSRKKFHSFIPSTALSGIDIALWDIKGKMKGEPISKLLGGRHRDEVEAYATGHFFKKTEDKEDLFRRIVEEANKNVEAGFKKIKLKIGLSFLGYDWRSDVELVERVIDALPKETEVMIDSNYAYNVHTAVKVAESLESLGIYWFEEPVPPENVEGYSKIRSKVGIPVAGGECVSFKSGFKPFFEKQALDIAQPDICATGGITETVKISNLAHAYGVSVAPHVWGTPITIAAALQLISLLPNPSLLEFDRSDNPLREKISKSSFPLTLPYVSIPERPGLGIEIDENILEKYRVS